jgi:hypothetical protein
MTLLTRLGELVYGQTSAALLCLVLQCLLPHRMQEQLYKTLLDDITSGAAPAAAAPAAAAAASLETSKSPLGTHKDARGVFVAGSSTAAATASATAAGEVKRVLSASPATGTVTWAPSTHPAATGGAAAAASPATASPALDELEAFLEATRLQEFSAALRDMGASSPADLTDLTALDFSRLGMKDLQRRRLKDALAHFSADGRLPPSPASSTYAASDPSARAVSSSAVGSAPVAAAAAAAPVVETLVAGEQAAAARPASAASSTLLQPVEEWDVSEVGRLRAAGTSMPTRTHPAAPPPHAPPHTHTPHPHRSTRTRTATCTTTTEPLGPPSGSALMAPMSPCTLQWSAQQRSGVQRRVWRGRG